MASRQADVILSGHNHDLHLDFDGRTALAESHQDANYVVVIDIDLAKSKSDPSGLVWWPDFKVIDTANVAPDPEILSKIRAYQAVLSKELDIGIATLATPLDSRTQLVRSEECAIGNLVADALLQGCDADCAITNGGGIRGNRIYQPGTLWTRRDVLVELPFGNRLVTVNMDRASDFGGAGKRLFAPAAGGRTFSADRWAEGHDRRRRRARFAGASGPRQWRAA